MNCERSDGVFFLWIPEITYRGLHDDMDYSANLSCGEKSRPSRRKDDKENYR